MKMLQYAVDSANRFAFGEDRKVDTLITKNKHAVALGRLGGKAGKGKRSREQCQKAARASHAARRAKKIQQAA